MSDDEGGARAGRDGDAAETHRLAATLLHDVGKYVARTARNLGGAAPASARPPPIEGALRAMLLRDVYETHGGRRASARFDELASALAPRLGAGEARLGEVRALLRAIDEREDAARGGAPDALAAIAADARRVEDLLRAIARDTMARARGGRGDRRP